jgi:Uma2 family endonuclease
VAAQTVPLSLAEFQKRYEGAKPAYEYWHGTVIQKSMPTALHGFLQILLGILLERAGWTTAAEVRLKIVADAELVPDLIAVRGKLKSSYPTVAPELCIEILSPKDTLPKALEKARTYIAWGSEQAWIIDPDKRTAWTLSQGAADPIWVSPNASLLIRDTEIDLPSLFAEVDRKLDLAEDEN